MVVVQQRLHQDDLICRLRDEGGWEYLEMPGECVERQVFDLGDGETWEFNPGDLLFEERFNRAALEQLFWDLGEGQFSAQILQRPSSPGGALYSQACHSTLAPAARRLLRLHEVRAHVSEARAWAAAEKHRLAECQSVQNLIKVVDDWLNKDRSPEPKSDSKTQERRRANDIIAEQERVIQETAALVQERDQTISEREFEIASREGMIADLQRRLAECEDYIVALRDLLPDEVREQALEALTSSRELVAGELAVIAERYHWRLKDLRHELENFTAARRWSNRREG